MNDMADRRQTMVAGQVLPNKVTDEYVAAALLAVPRERFVPKALRGVAYIDEDIPLGGGRYLLEPMVFARMLQAAEIGAEDVVLDVGCATGYSAAVIAQFAGTVVALEVDEEMAAKADENLSALSIDNAAAVTGPLAEGYAGQAPYDVIFVNGAVEAVPQVLIEQLREGGRLLVVERRAGVGKAMLYRNFDGVVGSRELFDAQVNALPGFAVERGFVF